MTKQTLLIVIFLSFLIDVKAQSLIFHENFENFPLKVTSVSVKNNNAWLLTTQLKTSGFQSIMAAPALSDTTYLITDSFSTVGMTYIQLEFNHIAKIEFFDKALIEYSTDNGQTWHSIDDSLYEGTALYGNFGNAFNSASYADWLPTTPMAVPDSSWWRNEKFNLSQMVANANHVRLRFALIDMNANGSSGNFGWIIDDLKIHASYSELQPPVLTYLPTLPPDTVYANNNIGIRLLISDAYTGNSGIDSAVLVYSINFGARQTISLTHMAPDTFYGVIPFPGFGRTIQYYAIAWDGSPAHNADSTASKTFCTRYSPGGTFLFGTGINSSTSYGPVYRPSNYSTYDFSRYSYLIPVSEMQNAGVPLGYPIGKIEWYKTTSHQSNGKALFKIYLKNSFEGFLQDGTLWSDVINTATEVLNDTGLMIPSTVGWIAFPVSPYIYTGHGLEISTDWDISMTPSNPPTTGAFEWRYSGGLNNVYTIGQGNQAPPNSLMGSTFGGNLRPHMRISLINSGYTQNDIGVHEVTSITTGLIANQTNPLTLTVKNYGTDTILSGSIHWQLNGITQAPVSVINPIFPNTHSQNYFMGNLNLPAGIHQLKIWTTDPNGQEDFNFMNDTLNLQLMICSSLLNGSYSIGGANSDFATISDAVNALNQCGISGSVVFNIANGIYQEQINLQAIPGASAANTVTFQSAGADSTLVEIRHQATNGGDNYVIRLTNTQFITFKQLSFSAANTNFSRIVDFSDHPGHISFLNNIFKATGSSTGNNENRNLVQNGEGFVHHLRFANNRFVNGSTAIRIKSGGMITDSLIIVGNRFENNAYTGIDLTKSAGSLIEENRFTSNLPGDMYQAIVLDSCSGETHINKNHILTTAAQNGYGISLLNCVFDTIQHAVISNNFIRLNLNSTSNTISAGILNYQSKNVDLVFNTILLAGNQVNSGAITLFDHTPKSQQVRILNNIITSTSGGYLIYIQDVDTSAFQSDYNNFYNYSGAKFFYIGNNFIGYTAWKNATAGDQFSDTLNPFFVSSTDLHVSNSLLNGRAIPVAGIVDDIDGDLRHPVTPDIGADEFDPMAFDLACLAFLEPVSGCGLTSSEQIVIRIKNVGISPVSGFSAGYQINNNPVVIGNIATTLAPGDTLDYPFGTLANLTTGATPADSVFNVKGWVALPADFTKVNDTTKSMIISGFTPPPPTFTNATIPYGQSVNLTAQSPFYIHWWNSLNSTVPLFSGTAYQTANLYDTTTFYLSSRVGTGLDTIQIGNGTATGQALPIEPYYGFSYSQSLYQPSFFNGKKGWINSLWYQYTSTSGYGPDALKIYMGNVNKSQFVHDSDWVAGSGLTLVYDGNLNIPTGSGWVKFPLITPFYYNGFGSLIIGVDENTPGYHASSDDFYCSQLSSAMTSIYYFDDDINPNPLNPPAGYGSTYTPNIRLEIDDKGCFSERLPLTVTVTGFPNTDAGITSITSPSGYWPSGLATQVKVVLKNYGLNSLTSAKIVWALNNTIIDTVNWYGNLATQATDTVILHAGYAFPGGIHTLTARSLLPNNLPDPVSSNDLTQITLTCCMSGQYTIGDTITGNADYGSFNGAVAAMQLAGVCGDIFFNVAPGVYTEQLLINGVNSLNQGYFINFQGVPGDSTAVGLFFSATSSAANYTLKINNSRKIIFRDIHIKASGSGFGGVIQIAANSSDNLFERCLIQSSVNTSANFFIASFDQSNRNTIRNSTLKDCNTALQFISDPLNPARGNQILNNMITGFRNYGIFAYYEDSLIVKSNTFQSVANAAGYGFRLQSLGSNVAIVNNKIFLTPSSTIHGIYNNGAVAGTTSRGLIANNFLVISTGTGTTNNGIYSLNATNYDYYHNSVHITSGVTSGRGMFITQGNPSQNCNFVNNILRVPNGFGAYISSSDGIGLIDYNVYYTSATNKFYFGANRTTFAAYLAANPKESHSLFHDPDFVSANDLHLTTSYLRSFGTPLPSVMFDIDDDPRGWATVAPGADEPTMQATDLGVVNITGIPDTTFEGYTYQVQAIVKNYGTDTAHQFTVNYQINSGTPVSYAVNTPLAPNQTANYLMPSFVSGTGQYTFCASTIIAGDTNTINDAYCASHFGISVKDAKLARILELDEFCGMTYDTVRVAVKNNGLDTINGTGQLPVLVSYRSNNLAAVTEPFPAIIPPGDSAMHQFTTLVYIGTNNYVDSLYQIKAWISYPGDSDHTNDTAYTSATAIHVPATPVANSPVLIPFGTSVTLSSSSPSGDSLIWYNQPQGTKIGAGTTYTTPVMTQQDTFFVQAGMGVSTIPGSLPTLYAGGNSYLGAMFNIQAINQITIDSFYINAQSSDTVEVWYRPGTYVGYTTSNAGWTLMGKHAVISAGSGNPTSLPVGGLTIPAGQTYGIHITFKTGTNALNYTNGNGSNQNYQNSDLAFSGGAAGGYFSATSSPRIFNGTIHYHREVFSTTSCLSDFKPIVVIPAVPSSCDIGVTSILSPDSSVYFTDEETVTVSVYNYGLQSQTNFPISYRIDQGPVVTENFNLVAFPSANTQFTFATKADLSSLAPNYKITAYTGLGCDTIRQNDTSIVYVAQKIYCISKSNDPLYDDLVNVTIGNWSYSSNPSGNMYSDFTQLAPKPDLVKMFPTSVSVSTGVVPPNSYAYPGWINLFIDYNQDGDFNDPGELVLSKQATANTTVSDVLIVPGTAVSGVTRMRVVFRENGTPLNTGPCGVYDYGETEDYFVNILPLIAFDAGITEISSPLDVNKLQSQPLMVKIANFGSDTIMSVDVHYQLNADPIQTYTVTQTIYPQNEIYANLGNIQLSQGHNDLRVYTVLSGDNNHNNDTLSKHIRARSFFTLPYFDDFEGQDFWIADTTNITWERGTPSGAVINSAYSPVNAWVTRPDSTYSPNLDDYLYTPQFTVLNGADSLEFSFYHRYHTEINQDGGFIQASVDSGNFWFSLGYMGYPSASNWYNTTINGVPKWSGNSGGWIQSSIKFDYAAISVGSTGTIMFRFVFESNSTNSNYDGWAIDNFALKYPETDFDAGVVAIISPSTAVMLGSTQLVEAVIVNYGLQPLTQIPLAYAVNGTNWVTEICSPSSPLNPGDSLSYQFIQSFIPPVSNFQLCVRTQLANDPYTFNNQICNTIHVTPALIDAGLKRIHFPKDTTFLSVPFNPSVVLVNAGINALSSAQIGYRIDNGSWITEPWIGLLAATDTAVYTFSTPIVPLSSHYKLAFRIVAAGDLNPFNDTLSVNLLGLNNISSNRTEIMKIGKIYPNPVDDVCRIPVTLQQPGVISIRFTNTLGQVVQHQNQPGIHGFQVISARTSLLPQGLYYCTIQCNGQQVTSKVIIQR